MLTVGITGGIGSGKSIVSRIFENFDIPVFYADKEAKALLNDPMVIDFYTKLLGDDILFDNKLNLREIGRRLFGSKELVKKVNDFIHPLVAKRFEHFKQLQQSSKYVIKESALIFENGHYRDLNYTILIIAPVQIRINRVQQRDGLTLEEIQNRMKNQWDDSQKIPLANFVLQNDGRPILKQIIDLHHYLLKLADELGNANPLR